jgi:hypothetical protein
MLRCLIAFAFLLPGCAAQWQKSGSTPEETRAALEQCEARAPAAVRPRPAAGPNVRQPSYNAIEFDARVQREYASVPKDRESIAWCMRGKGYVQEPVNRTPP